MGEISREDMLGNLPLQYVDGPDYCTVTDATGAAFALTVQPELMKLMERSHAAKDEAEPVAWRIFCTNNGATGYLYTEKLPLDPGPGVHVRRDPEPLYVATPPTAAQDEARERVIEALRPFSQTGWMTSDIEHTNRTVVAHMHPEREREIVLSSDDFKRARDLLKSLSPSNPTRMQGGEE